MGERKKTVLERQTENHPWALSETPQTLEEGRETLSGTRPTIEAELVGGTTEKASLKG